MHIIIFLSTFVNSYLALYASLVGLGWFMERIQVPFLNYVNKYFNIRVKYTLLKDPLDPIILSESSSESDPEESDPEKISEKESEESDPEKISEKESEESDPEKISEKESEESDPEETSEKESEECDPKETSEKESDVENLTEKETNINEPILTKEGKILIDETLD
jgi:hypothetical protein